MCKQILFLFLLIIFVNRPSNAQKPDTGCIVKGIVKTQSGTPLQGATVRLVDASDTSKIQMALTLPDGGFQLKSSCHPMRLTITMTGYEPYTHLINPAEDSSLLEVGLTANFQSLASVEVRASRRHIEVRNDRILINVEAAVSNAGASIMEVLEKSPGIAVDQDGVVSIQGKQGVLILIDGKRNQLSSAELAAFLRSLSSAQVDQIELITQPSAQYDATGNAGVINIRMKRSKTADFNGNISSAITQGRYTRLNQSIALDQRIGKALFSLGYTGGYLKGFYNLSISRRLANNTTHSTDRFEQHTFNVFRQIPHTVRFNMDYAFGKKTSLSFNNTLFASSYKDVPETQGFYDNGGSRTSEQSTGSNHIRQLNYSTGFNFRTILDTTGRELSVDGDFFRSNRKSNQVLYSEQMDAGGNRIDRPYHLMGYNPSFIQIAAARLDYSHPLTKSWKAETGLKYSTIHTDNKAVFNREVNGTWEPDTRTTDFTYNENIFAGYINLSASLKYLKLQSGLRIEATKVQALASDPTHTRTIHYLDLFPSVSVNYEKKKGNVFSLYYSQRIDRPSYMDMNPFQVVFNRYTYMQGNPGLVPQYTRIIEAGYAYKTNFILKTSYSYTQDIIGNALFQDEITKIAFQQKINMDQRQVISINSTVVLPVSKQWSATLFGNALYTSFKGTFSNHILHNDAYSFHFNLNNQFRFNKGWTAELSGSYFHKNYYTALLLDKGVYFVNAGVAKQVLGGKGSLRLAARDIFHTQYNRYITEFHTINIRMKQRQDMSTLTFAFTYRFGKTNLNSGRRNGSALEEINRVGAN